MKGTGVHPKFAAEFDIPKPPISLANSLEREARCFSAEILTQIFLSWRITCVQTRYAASDEERKRLEDGWVYVSARAIRELIRISDFERLSNMSFAVVCCLVNLGVHLLGIWPAALMTSARIDAAVRGFTTTKTKAPSINFDDYQYLGFLPFVLPCNRCASSQKSTRQGRPRICTFGGRDDSVCLACRKAGKGSQCNLVFCDVSLLALRGRGH